MSKTVFILGAGASHQAGAPLMADFLDAAEGLLRNGRTGVASSNFDEVFAAMAALSAAQSKATIDLDNLESVFSAFEMASLIESLGDWDPDKISRLPSAIRQLIVGTLENTIKFPVGTGKLYAPPPYEQFAELVQVIRTHDGEPCTIMTFNYDISLDYALHHNSIPIDYCLTPPKESQKLKFLKLHGSLNWGRDKRTDNVLAWEMAQFFGIAYVDLSNEKIEYINFSISEHFHKWQGSGDGMHPDPVIVPPTWSKTETYGSINNVWATAARELRTAERIIVIGYSLPTTDEFFRYLYAIGTISPTRIKEFLVYNPDTTNTVRNRFRALLGQSSIKRFDYYSFNFEKAIQHLGKIFI